MTWNWAVVWQMLASPMLPAALLTTVWTAILAQTFGTAIGFALGPASLANARPLRAFAWLYGWIFRGTPLLVQILFFFAVIPQLGLKLGILTTGLIALSLNEGARMAEIVRAGLISVPAGQIEAARSLGLKRLQIFVLVVVPQAIRVIVPPLGNNFNYMLKATSLLSVIGIVELLRMSQQMAQATTRPLEIYAVAACAYLVVTTSWDIVQRHIERRLARSQRPVQLPQNTRPSESHVERPAVATGPALVRLSDIRVELGTHRALDGIDFAVRRGEVVALVGPSGSGKTTLLRVLNGLVRPQSGTVEFDGTPLGRDPASKRFDARLLDRQRRRIGFVFQRFNLFGHLTALENVASGPRLVLGQPRVQAQATARKLLAKVGLADRADAYPAMLSGGQQQRVAIARALAMEPDLLLFDEPTSALDPETIREVLDVMRALAAEGTTMVVVTHEMGFAREAASRIVFLDRGRIVEEASPTAFFAAPKSERARTFLGQIGAIA